MSMQNIIISLLIVLGLLSFTHSVQSECTTNLLYSQDCSWYLTCLEDKYQCGNKGYPVGFGYKYCTKFYQLQQKASPIVKKWIQNTLICLKHSLIKYVDQSSTQSQYQSKQLCNTLRKDAFTSHPLCYTQEGFCSIWKQLGVKGSAQFLKQLLSVFQIKDFLQYQAIKQIFSTFQICAKKIIF